MPVVLSPAIITLFIVQRNSQKEGKICASSRYDRKVIEIEKVKYSWFYLLKQILIEVDALGLILLGFALSLFLLPFSLYKLADNGWKNPNMIAMIVIGGVLIFVFALYEIYVSPFH